MNERVQSATNMLFVLACAAVIIDEAHNVEDACREAASLELAQDDIGEIERKLAGLVSEGQLVGTFQMAGLGWNEMLHACMCVRRNSNARARVCCATLF